MALVFFDLDETLIAGDSDYEWGNYLVSIGKVNGEFYETENERYYQEYREGKLDIFEFLQFALEPLAKYSYEELCKWREKYIKHRIEPLIKSKGLDLVEQHRNAGDFLILITATNSFITDPIKDLFKIKTLIATEPAMVDGRFTGAVAGTPCFGNGKVSRVKEWLASNTLSLKGSFCYSDSRNDIPLLELVDHPIAVDADEELTAHAKRKGWKQLQLE